MCARVGNHRSRGVVIARLQSSVRNLLHQLIYLYLLEDREPTSHHRQYKKASSCEEYEVDTTWAHR
jgi:hypothetical protein